MADFDVNTITAAGATLIASATAGNKLVIDGCDATTDVLTKAQAVQVSTRPATPGSNTTEVALAGSTDNHVYAYAEFIRGQSTGGDFNTFYLYGHIQNTPSVVRVIAIASASSPTHLPVSGDVTNRTELQFELTFSATDEVVTVADSSMYTTRGEFLLLKERTVTTHAEGTPTTGEAQTIYGAKTFKNAIVCDGSVTFNDDINIGDDATLKTRNIEPTWGSPDIGTSSSYYGKIYCESSYCNEIYSTAGLATGLHNSLACSSDVWIGTGAGPAANVQTKKVSVVNPSYYSDTIEITYYEDASEVEHFCFNAGLVPSSGDDYDLGASGRCWDHAYVNYLKLPNVDLYYGNDTDALTTNGSFAPENDESYDLGKYDYKWNNVYAKYFLAGYGIDFAGTRAIWIDGGSDDLMINGSLLPDDGSTYNLGSGDYPFNAVYADTLHGCIPYPGNNTSAPPVGTIFLAILYLGQSSSHQAVSTGDTIDFTVATPVYAKIRLARFQFRSNTDIWFNYDSSTDINTGKYKVLTGGDNDLGSSNYHDSLICLVMRIQ